MSDPTAVNCELSLLAPRFRDAVSAALAECQTTNTAQGVLTAKIYEGFRSTERQAWLYAQGRTRQGKIVTNARTALTSWHGYGLAVDVIHTTKYWNPCGADAQANEDWFRAVAEIFKKHGCQWGGDWTSPDTPHMQWGRCTASPTAGAMDLMTRQGVTAVWASLFATAGPASAATANTAPEGPAVGFATLVPNGFFSSAPFDLAVRRSIRTNNPGALNISTWQRDYPGFYGSTQPDGAGNVTAIYRTPEHGVGAWFHLIAMTYGFGHSGEISLRQLAERYSGTNSPDDKVVAAYLAGWVAAAQGQLSPDSTISLGQDQAVLILGKAMFNHEAGGATPVHDDQILYGIMGERNGTLPA